MSVAGLPGGVSYHASRDIEDGPIKRGFAMCSAPSCRLGAAAVVRRKADDRLSRSPPSPGRCGVPPLEGGVPKMPASGGS
jgi:hypothetical protein